ncbi:MAG: winged helix DNA-binding protein [Pseudomonadota bacterium]
MTRVDSTFSVASSDQYDLARPALLFGDHSAALSSAAALLHAAEVRVAGQVRLADAADRLDQQIAVGLVWVECGAAAPSDHLLDRLARLAEGGEAAVVVSASPSLIDLLYARLDQGSAQILIDADDNQRAAALAVALARADRLTRVSDVGRDNAVRLRQLSDEMGRIAASLARLSSTPEEAAPTALQLIQPDAEAPPISVDVVRSAIRARRLRSRYFDEELFADPAWDMLLDLLQAELAQHRVPVSSLCIAAAVPATTALRWIKSMTDAGLFVRRADPHDGRRIFVELSPEASMALRGYFGELSKAA